MVVPVLRASRRDQILRLRILPPRRRAASTGGRRGEGADGAVEGASRAFGMAGTAWTTASFSAKPESGRAVELPTPVPLMRSHENLSGAARHVPHRQLELPDLRPLRRRAHQANCRTPCEAAGIRQPLIVTDPGLSALTMIADADALCSRRPASPSQVFDNVQPNPVAKQRRGRARGLSRRRP